MTDVPQFEVFTGSASKKKTGHGGYAAIVKSGKRQMELAGGFHLTSTERMELMAIIVGLETLPAPCQVFVYSNLVYSVDLRVKRLAKTWDENYWTLSDTYAGPGEGRERGERGPVGACAYAVLAPVRGFRVEAGTRRPERDSSVRGPGQRVGAADKSSSG